MPDQVAALVAVASPPTLSDCAGPALDTDSGGRVIPLDTRRRGPSPEAIAAARAVHPSALWSRRDRTG